GTDFPSVQRAAREHLGPLRAAQHRSRSSLVARALAGPNSSAGSGELALRDQAVKRSAASATSVGPSWRTLPARGAARDGAMWSARQGRNSSWSAATGVSGLSQAAKDPGGRLWADSARASRGELLNHFLACFVPEFRRAVHPFHFIIGACEFWDSMWSATRWSRSGKSCCAGFVGCTVRFAARRVLIPLGDVDGLG